MKIAMQKIVSLLLLSACISAGLSACAPAIVGGAVVGNEIQKHMTSKKVWATKVKMKDGTVKTFDQDAKPVWVVGNVVKADAGKLTKQP